MGTDWWESKRRNGVSLDAMEAVDDPVVGRGSDELVFRATNRWVDGCYSRTVLHPYEWGGRLHPRPDIVPWPADLPAALGGRDCAPTPVDAVLHALSACLTAGIARAAARHDVDLVSSEIDIEAHVDLAAFRRDPQRHAPARLAIDIHVVADAALDDRDQVVADACGTSVILGLVAASLPVVITWHTEVPA